MRLLSFVGECLRSGNQPIHAGLFKTYVCFFVLPPEIEILLFHADGKLFLKVYSKLVLNISMLNYPVIMYS